MKSSEPTRVAASQDAVIRSQPQKPEQKEHHEKGVITFSWMKTGGTSNSVSSRSEAEKAVAESMCLPLIMNEVDVGVALVDQGASRSVMRRCAYDRVKHRMRQNQLISCTLIYVTDDKKDNNVVCDLMLGRTFIAASRHSCVDTRGTGALVSPDSTCRRCQFIADSRRESVDDA